MSGPDVAAFYPVIVVGAGPTGLTLANLLARYGVETLIVDRKSTTVQEGRAVSIDDEALRTLQAAGLIEKVLPTIVPGYGSEYLSGNGECFLKVAPTGQPYGYPRRNAFRQPTLEAVLRDGLSRFAHCRALFATRLLHFEQRREGVTVELECEDGRTFSTHCAFLVGADGASSTVREQLGIELSGETFFNERWLIVDLENSPCPSRDTIVYCDARRPAIALPGPNLSRRFEFKLLAGETPEQLLDETRVWELLRQFGAAQSSFLARKVVYTFHARIAQRWSDRRVFLAGDACHLTPPYAGQGMNSGIRDAHNLAWKLAGVVKGVLGSQVLDSYEQERRPHVKEMIRLALRLGRLMTPSDNRLGALRQSLLRLASYFPPARKYFAEMRFKPAPRLLSGLLWRTTSKACVHPQVIGHMLPQPQVSIAGGRTMPLDELLGDGFALIGLNVQPAELAACLREPIFRNLAPRAIAVSEAAVAGEDVRTVADPTGTLRSLVPSGREAVLLVRPDRYVAAAFRLEDVETFAREAEQHLLASDWDTVEATEAPAAVRAEGEREATSAVR